MSRLQLGFKLMGFVKSLWPILFITMFTGILGFLCAIAIPVLAGYGVLVGLGVVDISLTVLFVAFAFCAVFRGILRYLEHFSGHYVAFRLLALFRDRIFSAMRCLAPAKMETRKSGDLVSLITTDIELLEVFYAHTIAPVIIAVVVSAGMTVFIGSFHWLSGILAAAAYISIGVIVPIIASKGTQSLGLVYRNAFSEVTTHFLDSLRGIAEILQFNQSEKRIAEIQSKSSELNKKSAAVKGHENHCAALTDALVLFFSGLMFILCAFMYQQGMVDIRGVIIPTAAMLGSFGAVLAVGNLSAGLHGTFAAAQRVFALLEEVPETEDIPGKISGINGDVNIKNVSFGYSNKPVLDSMSLSVKKGETIGIMGPSGKGKSTLLRLIMRFWDVGDGEIILDDTNVKQIPTSALRNSVGMLTQDTHIFNTTIFENIKIGKWNATDEEVQEAAEKASIHSFIEELDYGYKTEAGELGDRFSTGERQRIGLARMFLHDPQLMLLDEPTSNIDSLNERVVLKSIANAKDNKTVIIVSHKKSTLSVADRICEI